MINYKYDQLLAMADLSGLSPSESPAALGLIFETAFEAKDIEGLNKGLEYKSDKLPKPTDTMQNIQADGLHAFYAAHCDYFVVGDKNLRAKSKALYNYYKIKTNVLAPEEFVSTLDQVIHKYHSREDVLRDAISYVRQDNVLYTKPVSDADSTMQYAIKLSLFYLNFFNYATYTNYKDKDAYILTFDRLSFNYSNFCFYTEIDTIVDTIVGLFGNGDEDIDEVKERFKHKYEAEIKWQFDGIIIALNKYDERTFPSLTFLVGTRRLPNYKISLR